MSIHGDQRTAALGAMRLCKNQRLNKEETKTDLNLLHDNT